MAKFPGGRVRPCRMKIVMGCFSDQMAKSRAGAASIGRPRMKIVMRCFSEHGFPYWKFLPNLNLLRRPTEVSLADALLVVALLSLSFFPAVRLEIRLE